MFAFKMVSFVNVLEILEVSGYDGTHLLIITIGLPHPYMGWGEGSVGDSFIIDYLGFP